MTLRRPIALVAPVQSVPGFRNGLRHVSVVATLRIDDDALVAAGIDALEASLQEALPDALLAPGEEQAVPAAQPRVAHIAGRLVHWAHRLQRCANWPVFEAGLSTAQPGEQLAMVLVATIDGGHAGAEEALRWVIDAFNASADLIALQRCLARLPATVKGLTARVTIPSNTPRLLRAAFDMGMPISTVDGAVFRVGQGRWARWLNSSFTDATPVISALLTRDKQKCASVLRKAGMPAPQHERASSADVAVTIAHRIGYPVVIKPSDLDGGVGIAAGLRTDEEVRNAFATARKHSKSILVKKHFEGRDYRLSVFQGRMIWAIDRVPGGVTGDGASTVRELAAQLNDDPRRNQGASAPLKRLDLDEEASEVLARDGMSIDSVPAHGRFVPLRRIANIARGGMPVAVTDDVHPDNSDLAVRAAGVFRLDIAGIDLLIPDIKRSWLDSGALICEVNGAPTLGQLTSWHLYAPIVRELVNGNGRVPVAIVVGADDPHAMGAEIVERLGQAGLVGAWAARDGAAIGGRAVARGPIGPVRGGRMLAMDPRVEALVLFVDDSRMVGTGLPFERFDVLLVADARIAGLLEVLLPACDGAVATCVDQPVDLGMARANAAPAPTVDRISHEHMAEWLVKMTLRANSRHRGA